MLQTNLPEFQKITIFAGLNLYFDAKWDFLPLDCSLVDRSDLRKILTFLSSRYGARSYFLPSQAFSVKRDVDDLEPQHNEVQ